VENTSFIIESTTKKILRDTRAGSFKTNSSVMLENYFLPQFTTQRKVSNKYQLFDKIKEDGYDIIIGCDILKTMGLQIHYNTVNPLYGMMLKWCHESIGTKQRLKHFGNTEKSQKKPISSR
jgi:hypothetical protein